MLTYYRDPDVLITSSAVHMGGHVYRLRELEAVWHAQGRRAWGATAGRSALGLVILSPLVLGGLAVAVAVAMHTSLRWTLIVALGGVVLGVLGAPIYDVLLNRVDLSYDRGSRWREIWGRVNHEDVLLLRTPDAQRFGRIYRALERALETTARR